MTDRWHKPDGALSEQPELAVVPATPAAWPTGVSHLAQAFFACQRHDAVVADWLKRPNAIVLPPVYFPHAPAFDRVRQPKQRD